MMLRVKMLFLFSTYMISSWFAGVKYNCNTLTNWRHRFYRPLPVTTNTHVTINNTQTLYYIHIVSKINNNKLPYKRVLDILHNFTIRQSPRNGHLLITTHTRYNTIIIYIIVIIFNTMFAYFICGTCLLSSPLKIFDV